MCTTATSSGGAVTNNNDNSTSNDRINSMKMIYCVRAIGCCFRCDLIWWFDHISAATPSNRCWHRLVIGVEIYVKNFESCSFDLLCRIIGFSFRFHHCLLPCKIKTFFALFISFAALTFHAIFFLPLFPCARVCFFIFIRIFISHNLSLNGIWNFHHIYHTRYGMVADTN